MTASGRAAAPFLACVLNGCILQGGRHADPRQGASAARAQPSLVPPPLLTPPVCSPAALAVCYLAWALEAVPEHLYSECHLHEVRACACMRVCVRGRVRVLLRSTAAAAGAGGLHTMPSQVPTAAARALAPSPPERTPRPNTAPFPYTPCSQVEMDFKAECHAGDAVQVFGHPLTEGAGDGSAPQQFLHSLVKPGGTEVWRARTTWLPPAGGGT